jgi:Ca2+-binding EF-hand superfamily protein
MRFLLKAATTGVALVCAAGMSTGVVLAQDAKAGRGDMAEKLKERFAAADKNGDGKLSRDEAKAGMPFVYKHYDEIDKAHTGAITMADITAYAKQMRAAKSSGS